MLKTNLSTRPFYNERVVHLWLLAVLVVVATATAFNVSRLISYSRSDTELGRAAVRDESRVVELRAAASKLRASVDAKQIDAASREARQANQLIDRRTFSWTELFNRFETTLPEAVRITSIRPSVQDDTQTVVTVAVISRGGVDAVSEFMENLEQTGAFADLLTREDRLNDEDQLEAVLEMTYVPSAVQPAAAPSGGAPPKEPLAGQPQARSGAISGDVR